MLLQKDQTSADPAIRRALAVSIRKQLPIDEYVKLVIDHWVKVFILISQVQSAFINRFQVCQIKVPAIGTAQPDRLL
jgi:hypothetical protein